MPALSVYPRVGFTSFPALSVYSRVGIYLVSGIICLPSGWDFWQYPFTLGLGFLSLQRRPMIDYFS